MKRLAILGASGHGRVVADTALEQGWDHVVFFDDAWPQLNTNSSWEIMGNGSMLVQGIRDFDGVVVAIGLNRTRLEKLAALREAGAVLPIVQHPTAVVSAHASIGAGSVIFANVVVNAGAETGIGTILNTACTIDHDCLLGDGVHISPGAHLAGGVRVGNQSWIGIGACVKQMVKIGEGALVGAGAAVIANVPSGATVVGVPAKVLAV